ncbi:hypothetical protein BPMI_00567 [Candidatus Burkholderia pumila]|uniref:Uncharacterized protein n=1 Tax=Candidatus Burkholderia pumila TaxID=1090375 RepID=A0ABR5HKC6_9BURK|nr:hypothetical protein BPMI_00567 [Candidatus Burkholderia pumila]
MARISRTRRRPVQACGDQAADRRESCERGSISRGHAIGARWSLTPPPSTRAVLLAIVPEADACCSHCGLHDDAQPAAPVLSRLAFLCHQRGADGARVLPVSIAFPPSPSTSVSALWKLSSPPSSMRQCPWRSREEPRCMLPVRREIIRSCKIGRERERQPCCGLWPRLIRMPDSTLSALANPLRRLKISREKPAFARERSPACCSRSSATSSLSDHAILVLDEAGMVGSCEFALVQQAAMEGDAKLVAWATRNNCSPLRPERLFARLFASIAAQRFRPSIGQRTNFSPLLD